MTDNSSQTQSNSSYAKAGGIDSGVVLPHGVRNTQFAFADILRFGKLVETTRNDPQRLAVSPLVSIAPGFKDELPPLSLLNR
jgi:hypothetical protein